MSAAESVSGACLCGAVRYRADLPVLFCSHCHCAYCRRAHGAAFVTWFGAREQSCSIEQDGAALRWYSATKESKRGFCGTCGTTLFFASSCSPGELHIALGTADAAIDREPSADVFFDQHVAWGRSAGNLRRYDSDSEALATYASVPSPAEAAMARGKAPTKS